MSEGAGLLGQRLCSTEMSSPRSLGRRVLSVAVCAAWALYRPRRVSSSWISRRRVENALHSCSGMPARSAIPLYRTPVEPESGGDLVPERRLVQVAGGLGVRVQLPAVEGGPTAVGPAGQVGDEDVGVQVRVAGSAGAMSKRRCDETAAVGEAIPTGAEPDPAGVALHVLERLADCGVVCSAHCTGVVVVAEREQDRHRLRRVEGEIKGGDPVPRLRDEPLT